MRTFKITLFTALILSSLALAKGLKIKTHVGDPAGFLVTSHLIEGPTEAVLIDAQFTRSEAQKVVTLIQKSKKNLKAIYITHGHPDHYFGLEVITKAFPEAKVLATQEVIAEIKATAQGKIDYWGKLEQYKGNITETYVVPEAFDASLMMVDGEKLEVHPLAAGGESEHPTVVYVPSLATLIAGDLIYNKVHLWLAENRPDGWLKNIEDAQKIGKITKVLPGHGEPGKSDLFKTNADYIKKFVEATTTSPTRQAAIDTMKKAYPKYRLEIILDLSVGARLAE